MFKIELAKINDLDRVKKIANDCALEMISRKIFQWDENYPNIEIFKKDIDNQNLYVYTHIQKSKQWWMWRRWSDESVRKHVLTYPPKHPICYIIKELSLTA